MEDGQQSFWDYSLQLYAKDGFESAAISLQDDDGLDVNLLLACFWAAARGWDLTPGIMRRLVAATEVWQRDMVGGLRHLRRALKGRSGEDIDSLRHYAKLRELDGEKVEQKLIEDLLCGEFAGPMAGVPGEDSAQEEFIAAAAATNLKAYLSVSGLELSPEINSKLLMLLQAAFGGGKETDIATRLLKIVAK
ncbi:MAG: TIGR02444 family protein [Kiloniellales bacterium]|nr:TIGR02444 family protein [Kiloniellales bacterium]